MIEPCPHLSLVHKVTPSADGCEDCLKTGDTWVHLRLCMICGHVGCCDQSKNKHATKHFHTTHHPIISSLEPGEGWGWCYVDEIFIEPDVLHRASEKAVRKERPVRPTPKTAT